MELLTKQQAKRLAVLASLNGRGKERVGPVSIQQDGANSGDQIAVGLCIVRAIFYKKRIAETAH